MSTFGTQFDFLKGEIQGAWRYRWTAVIIAWVVAVTGWLFTYTLPNVYEAKARVYVETSTELRPLLQGLAIESDIQSQLDLVRQALLSLPTLERVGQKAGLFPTAGTPLEREKRVERLRKEIDISVEAARGTGNFLYSMTFRNGDRDKSVVVVSTLVESLKSDVIGKKRTGQDSAQQFLEVRIAEYEKRLSAAEERLADFKKRNLGLVPGESGDYFARMQAETRSMETARGALRVAEAKRMTLVSQLRGESAYTPAADSQISRNPSANAADLDTTARLQQAEARLQELLLRYTEQHPEVIAVTENIKELRNRQKIELKALQDGKLDETGGRTAFLNPIHQQIQLQLNQADVEIAALRGQISDFEARSAELRKMADTAPEVEAEYKRLDRDYGATHAQYQLMIERLERARLSDQANEEGAVKFSTIDPPVAKLEPVAPKRGLLIVAALLIGVVGGAGTAYLMHLTRPVFQNAKALAEATGLQVLGAVSLSRPGAQKNARARDNRRVAIAISMLLVTCAAVLVTAKPVTALVRGILTET